MRLIRARTLTLGDFSLKAKPGYAILSHTWDIDEEVSYEEFSYRAHPHKKGWVKIQKACELAIQNEHEYIWVDTCCIDKSSSAELSEAINSMFSYYKEAEECYAFLSDLPANDHGQIMNCRWWTRGWTLQELIAPRSLTFFDAQWLSVGPRSRFGKKILRLTGIPSGVFHPGRPQPLANIPVATRMSWAARRHTTRVEDEAYCLLGIFGISMPLLYGEGTKAFLRLQEEIIKRSNDLSIFAAFGHGPRFRFLSMSVGAFTDCTSARLLIDSLGPVEFTMTNRGLRFSSKTKVDIIPNGLKKDGVSEIYALCLCLSETMSKNPWTAYLCLQKVAPSLYRQHPDFPYPIKVEDDLVQDTSIDRTWIYEDSLSLVDEPRRRIEVADSLRSVRIPPSSQGLIIEQFAPLSLWDAERRWIKEEPGLTEEAHCSRVSMILNSIGNDGTPACFLIYWYFPHRNSRAPALPTVRVMSMDSAEETQRVRAFLYARQPNAILMTDFATHLDVAHHGSFAEARVGSCTYRIRARIGPEENGFVGQHWILIRDTSTSHQEAGGSV